MKETHLRAIASSLRYVEKHLVELRELLTKEAPTYEMYDYVDDLGDEYRERTLATIEDILSEVRRSKQMLDFGPTEMSLRQEAESVLSGVWVVIEGIRPKSLRGYGALSEADERTVAEIYRRLLEAQNNRSGG